MRIKFSKQLPSTSELAEVLKKRFSNPYSIKTFGLGKKSILVGKSTLMGAEVSVLENEISIAYSPPSVFGGMLLTLGLTELAVLLFPWYWNTSSYRELESEIGAFLTQRFN